MKKTVCLRVLFTSLLVTGLVTILGTSFLLAQTAGTGALTGTLTDPSGAVIANATVTLTNNGTQETRKVTTGGDGTYRFALLPPADYRVKFSAAGFKTVEVPSVSISVTESPVLNRQMEVGGQTENITVQEGTEAVNTTTSTLGTLVTSQTVTALPLTSRNYTQILGLSAGASEITNAAVLGRGTGNISVNGNSSAENNLQMDGVGINNIARSASNDDNLLYGGVAIPNPDSIQEFVVQTSSYDASFGRNPGANINVVTRSGTNQLHGTAFEFFRNAVLNAHEYFSKSNLLDQNQFGFTLGAPIKKNKIFTFLSYQGTRQKNGISIQGEDAPILPGLTNDRSAAGVAQAVDPSSSLEYCQETPGVSCDGTGVDPVALKILQLAAPPGITQFGSYFLPSGSGPFPMVIPAHYSEDQGLANVDYVISPKHTLSGRILISQNPQIDPFTPGGGGIGDPATIMYDNRNGVLKLTSVLSNFFTNEFRVSAQRMDAQIRDTPPPGSSPADLGLTPGTVGEQGPPQFLFLDTGLSLFGTDPVSNPVNQYQAADQIAWSHKGQTIRAGFEYEKAQDNLVYSGLQRGWIWFTGMGEFLQGSPFGCIFCPGGPPSGILHAYRLSDIDSYVQDDWKVSPRITFNLGVRWEYYGLPTDRYGNLTDINPALFSTVATPTGPETSGPGIVGYEVPNNYNTTWYGPVPAGVVQSSTGYSWENPPKTNFAPRFGFAWQPTSSGKLVVRGGFGLFYDRQSMDGMVHGIEQGPPYSDTLDYGPGSGHTLEAPFASTFTLGQFPSRWMNFTCLPDGTGCTYLTTNGQPGEVGGAAVVPGSGYSALNAPFIAHKIHSAVLRQYNLNVQYEFAPSWVVEVGYVGSSGINWFDQYHDLNIPQLATPENPINGQTASTQENIPLRVPILGYDTGGLDVSSFDGITNYNSLQLTLKKQFSHGLQTEAAYTFSKSLTDMQPSVGQPGEFAANINNPSIMSESYGPASYNAPQRFVVNYSYDLPFGEHTGALGEVANAWNVSGVTFVQKGLPLTIYDSSGGSVYGTGTSSAELCPGVTKSQVVAHGSLEQRAANGYYNAAAFCNEPTSGDGTDFGNMLPGLVRGPAAFNWDMSLQKNFKITEAKSVEFRTEFYNLFNHTQFSEPGAQQSSSNTAFTITRLANGQIAPTDQGTIISTAVNPRLVQFGLKIRF